MNLESKQKGSVLFWALLSVLCGVVALYNCWDLLIEGPKLYGIEIALNQHLIFLRPNATLEISSNDSILLKSIKTNIPFNLWVRIQAKGLDLEALMSSSQSVHDLLQGDWSQLDYMGLEFSFGEKRLGVINILFKPVVEDWLERAGMILEPNKRLLFLKNALISTDYDLLIQKKISKELSEHSGDVSAEVFKDIELQRVEEIELLWNILQLARTSKDSKLLESVGHRILELKPGLKEVYWALGTYWEESSLWDKAEEYYKMGLSQGYGKEFMLALARVLIAKGELNRALSHLNSISENDRDQEYYQLLYKTAEGMGDIKAMVEAREGYLALRPGDLEGRLDFLEFLLERNSAEKAKKYVEEVLERAVGETELLLRLAKILEKHGQRELLLSTYNAMLKDGLKEPVILFNLGSIEYEMGNLAQAKGYLEAYIEKEPKDETALRMLMDIYVRAKDRKKYVKLARNMLDVGIKEAWIYKTLCNGYLELGEPLMAAKFGEEGIQQFPKEKTLLQCLIASYLQQGKLKKAQQILEAYLSQNKDPDLLLKLSEIREADGDIRGAIKAMEEYMKIQQPDHSTQEKYLTLRLRLLEEKLH